ncbi:hypothetical protein BASA81_008066 [Batrachochytrium salamandrivorans]|nr:hypothetical protein BASA81_008066 [Batrachochytrium salamandrivorans]
MAKMTNRTLVLERPRIEETFAGFPETWGAHEYSLWDVDLLKQSPVQLLLPGEFTTLFEPHANCVWKDDATYLATWIFHTNQLEECHGRIHLATFNGIPSEYRTDTREFGVDPMLFWTYVRFRPNLFAFAKLELQQMLGSEEPQVGIHARTFRESHNSQQRVNDKVCGPQSRTTAQILAKRLNSRKQCGCPILDILYDDVEAKWDELRLNETCDLTLPNALPAITNHTSLDLLQHGFFMATDHEDEQVDELFVKRGAKMFNFTKLPKAHGLSTIPLEWINAVEPLSLDLVALITTREFYGVPASSLTRAVCSWRMNMGITLL